MSSWVAPDSVDGGEEAQQGILREAPAVAEVEAFKRCSLHACLCPESDGAAQSLHLGEGGVHPHLASSAVSLHHAPDRRCRDPCHTYSQMGQKHAANICCCGTDCHSS